MCLKRAFTLVEILIVVVILGILAAVVIPQFSDATKQASSGATLDQLVKIREAAGVYFVRNGNEWPTVVAPSNGDWGQITDPRNDYLKKPPQNKWVDPANATKIVQGVGPDPAYSSDYGWIYNPATGDIWAAGFDANDRPYPHP